MLGQDQLIEDNLFWALDEDDKGKSPFKGVNQSDLDKPVEQVPQWISNDPDQYPRVGLKT